MNLSLFIKSPVSLLPLSFFPVGPLLCCNPGPLPEETILLAGEVINSKIGIGLPFFPQTSVYSPLKLPP